MKRWICLAQSLFISVFICSPLRALAVDDSVTVTLYNQDIALINEVRTMTIPRGLRTVEVKDVTQTIDAKSLQVRSLTSPDAFKVLDQNYEYDLITVQSLLNKYVGKSLKVIVPDPQGGEGARIVRDAVLLANNEKPIFQMPPMRETGDSFAAGESEIYVGSYEAVILPEVPEGLRPQPTLVWLVDNQGEESQQIELSYLTGKMSWKADYVLKLDQESTEGALSAWVTLDNHSGKAFENVRLKLVAGDVHRVTRMKARADMAMRSMAPGAAPQEAMEQESLFEYHLYSLARPVNIANQQTKQVALLQSPAVKLQKRLVGRWNSQVFEEGDHGIQKQKLGVFLRFKNSEENGLGVPLPQGTLRAYQASQDQSVVFVGEDLLDHTARDREVELKMGDSFDVSVERKLTDFRRVGSNVLRYTWELRIKNSKETPQRVELEETMSGEWRVLRANQKYDKLDAHTLRFIVDVPPSGQGTEGLVTYEVEVR